MHRDTQGPFVGRVNELTKLTELRRESHRYGRVALVAGEPGIGKSRLVNEFLRQVPRNHATFGVGRALEHVRSPFLPWIAALESVSASAARAIRPNGPDFGDKAAMYESVVSALRESARRRSTILVLEDLHWADAGSLDLLHVLLTEIASIRRLLLLATLRPSEAREAVRVISAIPQAAVVELRALPHSDCVQLVRTLLPDDDSFAQHADRIAALSGGNPFFATELCKNKTPGEIPLTVSSAIESRITSLSPLELHALEAAAVLGEEFELDLLADVLRSTAAVVSKRLEPAERGGIVVEENQGAFRFAHALTRAVLSARLTSTQRMDLHRRAARSLERKQRFDAVGFAHLAYHHAGAHNRTKAYAYRMRAGGLAYSIHAYADAAAFYGDAAACAEPGSLERASALARQGDALLRAPELEDAERAYTAAIAIYRAAGSTEEAARLYRSLAHSLYNQDRVRDALALIEHASAELAPLPAHLSDEMHLHAALYAADVDPRLGAKCIARVNESNVADTRLGGNFYAISGAIYAAQGEAEAWMRAAEAFQKNAGHVQVDARYVGHYGNLAANALFLGFPATTLYEQCFALARTFKMDVYEAAYASHAAFERWLHGDDKTFTRLAAFASAHDAPVPALHAYVLLNSMLADLGAFPPIDEVEALVAGGRNEFFGPLVGVLVRRLSSKGEPRVARRLLDSAAERIEFPYAAWETLTAMAEFGSTATSERAEVLLQPYHDASAPAFAATAAMVRALRAQRDGDIEQRNRAASRAREIYAAIGWVHHQRRARELGAAQPERAAQPQRRLSQRELQIAQLLRQGRSNRAMAAELFISEKTVEKHLARLYEKLDVNNRAAAVLALTEVTLQE